MWVTDTGNNLIAASMASDASATTLVGVRLSGSRDTTAPAVSMTRAQAIANVSLDEPTGITIAGGFMAAALFWHLRLHLRFVYIRASVSTDTAGIPPARLSPSRAAAPRDCRAARR